MGRPGRDVRRTRPGKDDAPSGCVVRQMIQIAGSLLVLAGFALSQWGVLNPRSRRYLALNAVGSAILAVDALETGQWGFLLLEGVWAAVSTAGLIRAVRATRSSTSRSGPAVHSPTRAANRERPRSRS
jgi:hypothetical protein